MGEREPDVRVGGTGIKFDRGAEASQGGCGRFAGMQPEQKVAEQRQLRRASRPALQRAARDERALDGRCDRLQRALTVTEERALRHAELGCNDVGWAVFDIAALHDFAAQGMLSAECLLDRHEHRLANGQGSEDSPQFDPGWIALQRSAFPQQAQHPPAGHDSRVV